MKCELCHEADAQTVIYRHEGDKEEELYVCKKCAEEERAFGEEREFQITAMEMPMPPFGGLPGMPGAEAHEIALTDEMKQELGSLLDGLSEHLLNGAKGGLEGADTVCPRCGVSWDEVRETFELGCTECYATFREMLKGMMEDIHRCEGYRGALPKRLALEESLKAAREAIARAVDDIDEAAIARWQAEIQRIEKELEGYGTEDTSV